MPSNHPGGDPFIRNWWWAILWGTALIIGFLKLGIVRV